MVVSDIASLLFDSNRKITGQDGTTVIPDLAIRERHIDRLGITSMPVQTGAAITDHAFYMQPEFTLEFGWSNATLAATLSNFSGTTLSGLVSGDFGEQYIRTVYAKILKLQKSRQLCTVVTGKRTYKNVLIESVETNSSSETAYSMFAVMNCRSLNLAHSAVTQSGITAINQKIPASTSPEASNGTKQLQPASNSSGLASMWSGVKSAFSSAFS
ncbi:phage baseplate protein [Acetobacter thailandicus]|uniref:Dit-like phage tail protein N-terminal domain-containing protein n=1 Tax=Acetobacter thailandicus TaxID=1502842 RepID=A0ABT3QDD7_9PROT|nr:hypothetical protein [Acetobacter thailandicus]MCX2563318.1 hypothetical protein [Acetobacter thailandicus]NHN94072.1 hypothetical protein [Acetobacter thailandicus]